MSKIYAANVAEQAIHKYSDPALWARFVCGVELDPLQIWDWERMNTHPNTINWAARGMRKSSTIGIRSLYQLSRRPDGELLNVQPRKAQADKFMKEHMLQIIWRSDILLSYINRQSGRKKINETSFEFQNYSKAWGEGVYAKVDGGTITIFVFDEVEDMDVTPLTSNFLPMIARTERMGSRVKIEPEIRVLGVMKGSEVLDLFMKKGFYCMTQPDYPHGPIIGNAEMGLRMGILNHDMLAIMRETMHPDDYTRQMECKKVESDNVIRYSWIRRAMTQALEAAPPMPGREHQRRGVVSIGYDHLGHGQNENSSKSALVVAEMIGEYVTFPYVRTWPADADETRDILPDLVSIWRYFRPDIFNGDAYGIGLLTALNDELWRLNLTNIDRRTINEGRSTESSWVDWAAKPVRFGGLQKHNMIDAMRLLFQRELAKIPWFDDSPQNVSGANADPLMVDYNRFIHQLANINKLPTKSNYPSYKMDKKDIGDDLFDAASAAVWGLVSRGLVANTVILVSHRPQMQIGRAEYLPKK
jgi:hypothetical protein